MQIEKIKKPVDLFISSFSIIVMVLLVICVTWQVFSRYVLQIPSTVTDEIARFSMIWVGLLGAAYTVGVQRHLSIDLFTHNLTGKKKQLSNIIIRVCPYLDNVAKNRQNCQQNKANCADNIEILANNLTPFCKILAFLAH